MKKITAICVASFLFLQVLTGCGAEQESEELTTYKASMETFFSNVAYLDEQMNSINADSDDALDTLLSNLDQLAEQFNQMAELEVPEQFENVEELADQAAENMVMAVNYYHEGYEGETAFNQNYIDAANEYYKRANLRIKYILQYLHGEEIQETEVSFDEEYEAILQERIDNATFVGEETSGSDTTSEEPTESTSAE
ncbi:MAG: hypothetical protein K6G23_09855 [Lachnospiraceae bacterium]|nr:hypothetical protein [Lachnospiraceae bacterium]